MPSTIDSRPLGGICFAGVGPFEIRARDAVIFTGDFNLVGFHRQLDVLLDGTFIDPANGPDFAPGRGRGSLRSAELRHTNARAVRTWRLASSDFAPGKLDYVLYSGDVARWVSGYVLDTSELPRQARVEANLRVSDSLEASDHLALVADFVSRRK
jgi:Endonuclease/Exonuclease/phosphatase family